MEKIDGEVPRNFFDFQKRLLEVADQRAVWLTVGQGSDQRRISIDLVREDAFFNENLVRTRTGASVQELTADLARAFGLGGVRGLLVAEVEPNTPAGKVAKWLRETA